jgi:PPM family protein phosphatase
MHFDTDSLSIKGEYHDDNQDSILMDPKSGIFIVADGLGGAPAGAEASQLATSAFYKTLIHAEKGRRTSDSVLDLAVQESVRKIQDLVEKKQNLRGMGTTLSAMVFNEDSAKIAHLGDSMILQYRGSAITQLTQEHTMAGELVKQGFLELQNAENHPLKHVLSKCVGPMSEVHPDITSLAVMPGDVYVLGSDGLLKLLRLEELRGLLERNRDLSIHALMHKVRKTVSGREFVDDFTLGLIRISY